MKGYQSYNIFFFKSSAGLAIAGKGGVASSKPVGTAVVGPGGLAVARPVATAIAGVNPNQISALGLPLPSKLKDVGSFGSRDGSYPLKGKYGLLSLSEDDNVNKLLVGPTFFAQARRGDELRTKDEDDENLSEENLTYDEGSKKPYINSNSDNQDVQVDPSNSYEYPFDYNRQPHPSQQFPPSFDLPYNYMPYYLPPYNLQNMPYPAPGQYFQRRTMNPNLRYASHTPQVISAPINTPYGRFVLVQ